MISHGEVMTALDLLLIVLATALAIAVWRLSVLLRASEEEEMRLVISFSSLIEMKDGYTEGHCARVKNWAAGIGRGMGMSRRGINDVVIAAMLHDIGKIGVPDAILNKPAKLDEGEFKVIQGHPARGADVLAGFKRFAGAAEVIRHHHEAYDGTGYPSGLRGERIPRGARIVAVIDAYDAMTSTRSYRPAMPAAKGMAILREGRGTQFDAEVVDVFCRLLAEGMEGRIDPVCGMAGDESRHVAHGGNDYYFCSAACREEFLKNPAKYAASVAPGPPE
ncbi:MAG: HD domain-containing protein [Nitrospinae bacterium]|nr:HD domain-containing protein [Nitrospinota bacterium]